MNNMFEIVPKHPECKKCKHINLSLEQSQLIGDGTLLSNCFRLICEHQDICADWMELEKKNVHGNQLF